MTTLLLLTLLAAEPAATQEYTFGFLVSAPNRVPLPKEDATKLQAAHLAHLSSMAANNGLVAAGPLANGGTLRGVLIFKTPPTLDEAIAAARQDPMVKAGQMAVELWRWTGPKDIGEEFARQFRASGGKVNMKMVKRQLVLGRHATPVKDKLLAAGELHGDGRHVYIHRDLTPEEVKALSAGGVQVLDWYVADGVLPEPAR